VLNSRGGVSNQEGFKAGAKFSPAMSLCGDYGRRKKKLRWPDGEGPPISERERRAGYRFGILWMGRGPKVGLG
jgi:hypothetical protein